MRGDEVIIKTSVPGSAIFILHFMRHSAFIRFDFAEIFIIGAGKGL
jgi:hypothetical protein